MGPILPYIFPLILGRTFDLDKMQVGVDIFSKEEISKTMVLDNPMTETLYKVVESGAEARDLLDVGGSFALKVKANLVRGGASGDYLADTYNRENVVEVTVKATYQTATEQVSSDVRPLTGWRSMGSALGSHFVRSLTYGGELIAAVRMVCNNTSDKQRVKAAFDVGGRIKIFDLGVEVEGDYMKTVGRAVDSTEIKVFSSVPIRKIPDSIESLKEMLDSFPEEVSRYHGGRGVPIKMELWPLEFFDSSRKTKVSNRILEAHLSTFELKFDDLLNTKAAIANWMKAITRPLSQDEEKKVGQAFARVQRALHPFYEVIGRLDSSLGVDQLKPAMEAYGDNLNPGAYFKEYLSLRQALASDQGEWILGRGSGATYIHWGRDTCSDLSETLTAGHVHEPLNAMTDFLCLTDAKGTEKFKLDVPDARGNSTDARPVPCCRCNVRSKGSVLNFPGLSECPPSWDKVYSGVLASGRLRNDGLLRSSATAFCLDGRNWNETSSLFVPSTGVAAQTQSNATMLVSCVMCAK